MTSSFTLDLHIHSPASSCFSDYQLGDKAGPLIVQAALKAGLDMIAITDHHSVDGVDGIKQAALGTKLVVLPGIELSARIDQIKEVYLLAVFKEAQPLPLLRQFLMEIGFSPLHWGHGSFLIEEDVGSVLRRVNDLGGILISARSDKTPYRQAAIPGLVEYGLRAFDLVYAENRELLMNYQDSPDDPIFCFQFSDAHSLAQIGGRKTILELEECSFEALKKKIAKEAKNDSDD